MAINESAFSENAAGTTARTDRPLSLAILTLAVAAIGAVLLLWAGAWFGASDFVAGSRLASAARGIGLILVAMAILELALAYGVWRLRPWAWPLGVGATVGAMLLTLLSAGRGAAGAHTLSMLLEVGTLWYLLSPKVRDAFGRNRSKS